MKKRKIRPEIVELWNRVEMYSTIVFFAYMWLRVLLFAQKSLSENGKMTIRNVKPEIMEVFDITGFIDILTIEEGQVS